MRYFIAFIITFVLYILIVLLYIKKFSHITVDRPLRHNNHIIKIDIKNIPDPIVVPPPAKPMVKVAKKVVPKKPVVKKKIIKKKVVKKRPIIKKKPKPKKRVIKKRTIQRETFTKRPPTVEEPIFQEPIIMKEPVEEILYIPEPIIQPQPQAEPSTSLSSFLGSPSTPVPTSSRNNYPNQKIRKLYGSSFHNMTPTQKQFIEENLDSIQEITQRTLTRRGYPEGAGRTKQEGTNVVTFKLHPNGNISNLRLKTRIGYRALDENTLSLIKVAYKDYPYPSSTTQITFYVTYTIYGY